MEARQDKDWLLGEPRWGGLDSSSPPDFRHGELAPPATWVSTVPSIGKFGWCRQRYRPLAWSIVRPFAWSPFFLAISVIPLLIQGKTPNDQVFSAGLFLLSWGLVMLPLILARNSQPMSDGNISSLPVDWASLLFATALFPLHIIFDHRFGWAAYIFYWVAYIRTVQIVQKSMIAPSARFLLPIEAEDWPSSLEMPWKVHSSHWKRGLLASARLENGKLVIYGTSRSGTDFLALAFVHKSGFVQDPFHRNMPFESGTSDLLASLSPIVGIQWPENFLNLSEEE